MSCIGGSTIYLQTSPVSSLGGVILEIRLGIRFGDWLVDLRQLRATVVCIFSLSLPCYDSVQALEHLCPSFVVRLLSASDIVQGGRTPVNFAEGLLILSVVAIDVHCIDTFNLGGECQTL